MTCILPSSAAHLESYYTLENRLRFSPLHVTTLPHNQPPSLPSCLEKRKKSGLLLHFQDGEKEKEPMRPLLTLRERRSNHVRYQERPYPSIRLAVRVIITLMIATSVDSFSCARLTGTTRRFNPCEDATLVFHYGRNDDGYDGLGEYDPSEDIRPEREVLVGDPQIKLKEKERSVTSILKELAAIQQQGPQKYCILGTRHCSYLHQQIIELLYVQ